METKIAGTSKNIYIYFVLLVCLYIYYRSTHITFGDGIVFMYTIAKGYDISTTATTHLLYINFLKVVNDSLPFFDSVAKAVGVSIMFSIFTLSLVYRSSYILTENRIASIMSTLLLGLSFTYWRQTEIIEVYTTNCFIVSLLIWAVLKKYNSKNFSTPNTGIILGLSLLIHIQNILLIPFYIFHLINHKKDKKYIIIGLASFIVLSSILFAIPLLFDSNSITSIFFLDERFKAKAIAFDLAIISKGFFRSILYFLYNYIFFIFFMIHGAVILYKKDFKLFCLLFVAGAPIWLFSMKYDVTDNYVFFLTSYIICCIVSSLSFAYFLAKINVRYRLFLPSIVFILPLFYYVTCVLAQYIPQTKEFRSTKAYKGGLKYYLWPGMRNNVDMLTVSSKPSDYNIPEGELSQIEWNFKLAEKYKTIVESGKK